MMVAFVPPAKSLEMNMGKVNGKLHLEWFNPLAAMNKPIQSHTVTIQKGEVLSAPFPHNKALTQGAVLLVTPVSPDSH